MILKLKTSIKRHTTTTKIQNYNKEAGKKNTETQNEVKETNMITKRHKQPQRNTLKKRIENNHKMSKNGLKEMNTDHNRIQSELEEIQNNHKKTNNDHKEMRNDYEDTKNIQDYHTGT